MANVTTPTVPGTPTVPAVSPAPKPRALQKFVRGADGKIKVMYVTEQGLPIPPANIQAGEFEIATNDQSKYYGQDAPAATETKANTANAGSGVTDTGTSAGGSSTFADQVSGMTGKPINKFNPQAQPRMQPRNTDGSQGPNLQGDPNLTGYTDKPGWLGATSMLPGAAGMAGRAVNAGINLGNHAAVNNARESIGLDRRDGLMDTARGIMRDNQGQVADASINGEDYSVGIGEKMYGGGGLTPQGNTSLTPNEARNRALTLGGITEIPQRQGYQGSIPGTQPQSQDIAGILSGVFDNLKNSFGSLLSGLGLSAPMGGQPSQAPQSLMGDMFDSTNPLSAMREQSAQGASQMPSQGQPNAQRMGGPTNPAMGQFGGLNNGWMDLTPEDPGTMHTPSTTNPAMNGPPKTGATFGGDVMNTFGQDLKGGLTNLAKGMMPGFQMGAPATPGKTGTAMGLLGLGDLGSTSRSKPGVAKISYDNIGPNRHRAVNSYTEGLLGDVVGKTLGAGSVADVVSGDVNPEDHGWNADGGKYSKSHRHTDELGADVKFRDPETGKVVNLNKDDVIRNDLAMGFAAENPGVGLGFGSKYMGDETMHVDFSGKGGMWNPGGGLGWTQLDRDNVAFARETGIGPTPRLGAPTPTASPGVNSPVADYAGGGTSAYGLDTAVNRYDSPKEKNAKSISKNVADSAKATAGKTTRSESTEAAKADTKSDKSKSEGKSEASKSEKSDNGSNKSEKSDNKSNKSDSSASKESSKSKGESKGKDHSKGGRNVDQMIKDHRPHNQRLF